MAKSLYLAFDNEGYFAGVYDEPYARTPLVDKTGANAEFETFWAADRKIVRILSIKDEEEVELRGFEQDNEALEQRNAEMAEQINAMTETINQLRGDSK